MTGDILGTGEAGVADRAVAVLRAAGVPTPYRLEPIVGGGNNRVYRVESAGPTVVLKAYFRHPDDPRDRLRADFGFSTFAWACGARALPRPLASDPDAGMAVYEFVTGRTLAVGDVTAREVGEAAAFFRAVNAARGAPGATDLPAASEACFSIMAHVGCVDRRIARLGTIDVTSPRGADAAALVEDRLVPVWSVIRATALAASGAQASEPLGADARCLNPSDFGFHNAIAAADGRLRFLDFEYAGWDDPAKAVCDFFCQPAVPVPLGHLPAFLAGIAEPWGNAAAIEHRVATLLPVYGVKWCCIMLNEFIPADDTRRAYAAGDGAAEPAARRARQLDKVAAALERMGV